MNSVKVYQIDMSNPVYRNEISCPRGEALVKAVNKNLDLYEHVATIDTTEVELSDILERAYSRTNSYEMPWFKDPRNRPTAKASEGCRSTSVGDVLEFAGVKYVVDSFGFKCL